MSATENVFGDLAKKYKIHPESEAVAKLISEGGVRFYDLDLNGTRKQFEAMCEPEKRDDFDGTIEELLVPRDSTGGVPVTVFKSSSAPADPLILIHLHGGGLVAGSRASYDHIARHAADLTSSVVVNVEYRRMPGGDGEGLLPSFDDCTTVARWVLDNREKVGGTPASKVGLIGDSAGGQLVCSVTNDIAEGFSFQVLIYPVTNVSFTQASSKELHDIPLFNTREAIHIYSLALAGISDAQDNPRLNPCIRKNLAQCPPTFIQVAELDGLKDQGIAFGEQLKEAGVATKVKMYEGLPHIFMLLRQAFPSQFVRGWQDIADFIKSL
ncbi:versiconal hemiacetal acetate esterase [Aplysia californica]|uniref:Versiconal hemiacetal acetate esterase n=1 Tax=Aplysia californica TaxID=6500 RepID=A0ABM0JQ45_APLCA|nr:versiconal hemiacetal acetate esterase [Aplysia californica]XP_005098923.1 versiconal hemiacetal acetate esterase [Aplysia californica]XP_035825816.1 versiconal hemiacetal acetate esterase [Aplysia californica]